MTTKKCKLVIHDEVNASFEDLDAKTRRECNAALKFFIHAARHMPAFKLGRWDGCVSLFALNGNTYVNLLDKVLDIVVENGYEIELVDRRITKSFEFPLIDEDYVTDNCPNPVWPKGHPVEGQPIKLRDYQVEIIRAFLENPQCIQEIATGAGKEQPISSKIKIPGGWTTMGDIKLGDIVSSPNGGRAKVIGVHPQGIKDVYTFTFSDGRTAQAGAEHLWRVHCNDWRSNTKKGGPWRTINTLELINQMNKSSRKLSIQLVEPEITPRVDLPIDPYVMGIMLGDGTTSNGFGFSSADQFIVDEMTKRLPAYDIKQKSDYDYRINMTKETWTNASSEEGWRSGTWSPIKKCFKEMGLLGKRSFEKFIPDSYLSGSLDQKKELICGLMDSNGYVSDHKEISFCTTSKTMAYQMVDLLRSLGAIVTLKEKMGSYRKDGILIQTRLAYNLSIRYKKPWELFKLPRKLSRIGSSYQYSETLKLGIQSIELTGSEESQCITIDSDDHLYITDNWVVTHNTLLTAALSHLCEEHGRTIVIVPNKSLVDQTEADYKNIGLDVGVYYGDRKEPGHTHTICTWQSLHILDKNSKKPKSDVTQLDIDTFTKDVVAVMVDETHMAKADVLKNLLCGPFANVPIRWGLTGTVPKEEHEFTSILASIGPVVNRLAAKDLMDKGVLANCHVDIIQLMDSAEFSNFHEENNFLVTDSNHLDWISDFTQKVSESGNTLVLVNRIETGKELEARIPNSKFVYGSVKAQDRKDAYDEIGQGTNQIAIASYGVAAVGINIPRIFNLILVEPGKSFVRVIQSIGRGIRKANDKDYVQIYDIASTCKFSAKHVSARKKIYKEANYPHSVRKVDYLKELS